MEDSFEKGENVLLDELPSARRISHSRPSIRALLRSPTARIVLRVLLALLALHQACRFITNTFLLGKSEPEFIVEEVIISAEEDKAAYELFLKDVAPKDVNPEIADIARLMTDLHRLFVEMRYILADNVAFPPHDSPGINLTEAHRYGLTKDVTDLLQMMPRVTGHGAWDYTYNRRGEREFMFGAQFGDMHMLDEESDYYQYFVDPLRALWGYCPPFNDINRSQICPEPWNGKGGYYMMPHFATLSGTDYGNALIVDTQNYRMWIANMGFRGSSDPLFWGAPFEHPPEIDLYNVPSRSAVELLRDVIKRFRRLDFMPGGLYGDQQWEYKLYKELYLSSGWPRQFNATAFEIGRETLEFTVKKQRSSEQPLWDEGYWEQRVRNWEQRLEEVEVYKAKLESTPIDSPDRAQIEWVLRDDYASNMVGTPEQFVQFQNEAKESLRDLEMALKEPDLNEESRNELEGLIRSLEADINDADGYAHAKRKYIEAQTAVKNIDPQVLKSYEWRIDRYGN